MGGIGVWGERDLGGRGMGGLRMGCGGVNGMGGVGRWGWGGLGGMGLGLGGWE